MKRRLDQLVVERGLASGRDAACRLILAGRVHVDGEVSDKAGRSFPEEADISLVGEPPPYVSRGGVKLAGALDRFGVELPSDCLAIDIGASTGGFTDCLLQRGVAGVIAVDTGRGQIHERLRADPRVTLFEKTNARYLTLEKIGGIRAGLIVIDVSFISLRLILPVCTDLLEPSGSVLALIKPQFEAGRGKVRRGGIVRDRAVHREVLDGIVNYCVSEGWRVRGLDVSSLLGAKGNMEFFIWLERPESERQPERAKPASQIEIEPILDRAYNLMAS